MTRIRFTKMQGTGNDFVVLDGVRQSVALSAAQIRRLADRRYGVGCDQVLLVEAPVSPDADFRYRIFNSDGGEVSQCGNGARCLVRFVRDQGLTQKKALRVETAAGIITPSQNDDGEVTVGMGAPRFRPADIPFIAPSEADSYVLDVDREQVTVHVLSMGNPHAVQRVADVDRAPVATQGARIETHPRFPERVNAGYMQVVDRANIRLRVWERGAGETLACGTGACAAAVSGIRHGVLDHSVRVEMRGGEVSVRWDGGAGEVMLTGPAASVFEGVWEVPSD